MSLLNSRLKPNRFREQMQLARRAARSFVFLDPLLTPLYRRWHKSLRISLGGNERGRGALTGHLSTLVWECMRHQPRVTVELGVRGGQSTAAFVRCARTYGGVVVSCDVEPTAFSTDYDKWLFYRERSQDLGARFEELRAESGWSAIDLLFVDSSHLYEETREELRVWLPHVSERGLLIFHDTNMSKLYRSSNGGLRRGWDNARGVTRAMEEVLGIHLDEGSNYVGIDGGWLVNHAPLSSGLTMLTRTNVHG